MLPTDAATKFFLETYPSIRSFFVSVRFFSPLIVRSLARKYIVVWTDAVVTILVSTDGYARKFVTITVYTGRKKAISALVYRYLHETFTGLGSNKIKVISSDHSRNNGEN